MASFHVIFLAHVSIRWNNISKSKYKYTYRVNMLEFTYSEIYATVGCWIVLFGTRKDVPTTLSLRMFIERLAMDAVCLRFLAFGKEKGYVGFDLFFSYLRVREVYLVMYRVRFAKM